MKIKDNLIIFRMWYRGVVRSFPLRNESKDSRELARHCIRNAKHARDIILKTGG